MDTHSENKDAVKTHLEALEKAQESGRWMAAVWLVDDDGLRLEKRTTWDFPIDAFSPAVDLLAKNLKIELVNSGQPLPLSPRFLREDNDTKCD